MGEPEAKAQRQPMVPEQRRIGRSSMSVTDVGDVPLLRERMEPGWRWSTDMKPVVGTDLCRAMHQLYVVSGRLRLQFEDRTEIEVAPGDAAWIPPGHDAWVVGDEACEIIDLSPSYVQLIAAGEAYLKAEAAGVKSRTSVAERLRAEARRGALEASAVELVLGAHGHRPGREHGPAGLTSRELEVLVLIATGASAKQVASVLGIALKTATTHIERIYTKCGVSSRAEVTHFAIAHGIVRPLAPS